MDNYNDIFALDKAQIDHASIEVQRADTDGDNFLLKIRLRLVKERQLGQRGREEIREKERKRRGKNIIE